MADSVVVGQYIEGQSLLHKLDPRTKFISMLAIMLWMTIIQTPLEYVIATIVVFFLIGLSRLQIVLYWKALQPALLILLFTVMYHAFLSPGEQRIWEWGVLQLTKEGIVAGIQFVWRIVLLILLASILTFSTKPLTLALGVEMLLKPFKKLGVPVQQFSLMISIALRFIPTILEELKRIQLAQKSRGLDVAQYNQLKQLYMYFFLLIPLLYSVIQRAETLSDAIDSRAYGDGRNRTHYQELCLTYIDYSLFILVWLLVSVGIFVRVQSG